MNSEKLEIKKLTKKDIGRWVLYRFKDKEEVGRIKCYGKKYVGVVYFCNDDWDNYEKYTAEPTFAKDLTFFEEF